ncbi:acyltransferase family protein [Cellvibrio sp. UBA7671]|uniref:acyltransferase family protein n=1 Tax=Cellvibrio sp. UBA7671 TaxID=1946312 RepID=UPI002F35EA6A
MIPKNFFWQELGKKDLLILKGIAITLIVFHNFMHLLPSPRENEFYFDPGRIFLLFDLILSEPENSAVFLFSYFGHFGVQVFVFVSAYGLTKKMLSENIKYWYFIFSRLKKIYPAFLLAILFWATYTSIYRFHSFDPLKIIIEHQTNLLLRLSLLSNFVPGKALIPVGPWWFLSFIFQLYIIFPLLLKCTCRYGTQFLIAITLLALTVVISFNANIKGVPLFFTVIAHIPVICLGIYLAKNDSSAIKIPYLIIPVAFVAFSLGNVYLLFWYTSHLFFLILLLAAIIPLLPKIQTSFTTNKILIFMGTYSMPLFLVNAFLRKPWLDYAIAKDQWFYSLIMCLIFFTIAVCSAVILQKITTLIFYRHTRKIAKEEM